MPKNYCYLCTKILGNVHPKNKNIAFLYDDFSGRRTYKLSCYAHKKCIENDYYQEIK